MSASSSSSSSSTQTAQGAPASQAGQGAQRRMIIAKMFLVNFKSYAGRIEVGPFHKVQRKKTVLARCVTVFRGMVQFTVVHVGRGTQRQRQVQRH